MKRLFTLSLTVIIAFCILINPAAISSAHSTEEATAITQFKSDTYSVISGNSQLVEFFAVINNSKKVKHNEVKIFDDNNKFVAYMRDDGQGNDKLANDGIYSAQVSLNNDEFASVDYHAEIKNIKSNLHTIKFRNELSDNDFKQADLIWNRLKSYENSLSEKDYTVEQIADMTYDFLLSSEQENIYSINKESKKAFSFTLNSGIENYFEHYENMSDISSAKEIEDKVKSLSYIKESSIGVWCPYYGLSTDFTLSYADQANKMKEAMNYAIVDTYYGADASLDSFKNFDKYGIVLIDSHGADYNGGGYVCIPRPGEYDKQDVADGHIILSGGTVCMSATYIEKYCETLPNSIVYTGICKGLANDKFYQPLLNHGAGFVAGYDNNVSFTYDGLIMESFCNLLVSTNPATNSQYTAGEAYDKSVQIYGDTDQYASENAKFVCYGDANVVAQAKIINVESIAVEPAQATIYSNNIFPLELKINPDNANKYTTEWKSDNESVAAVDENGIVKAISDGIATITCTVTNTDPALSSENISFIASSKITVAGNMPVSGIELARSTIKLFSGTAEKGQIIASVIPSNASNQVIHYSSSNTDIALVDEYGFVTPINNGTAYITASTADGGFSKVVIVNIVDGDLNSAVNVTNGALNFENDSNYPLKAVSIDDRFAVQTTNKRYNSNSSITLKASKLKVGDVISFDWKASCEAEFDKFSFSANGEQVKTISGSTDWANYKYTIKTDGNYVFRWSYIKDYSTDEGKDCCWLDNVDVITSETHKVTFMVGDTIVSTQNVKHAQDAIAPTSLIPMHPEYELIGWSNDYTQVRGDVITTAVYSGDISQYCVVTFVGMNEEVIDRVFVEKGKAVIAPDAPEIKGYVFIGWDSDLLQITIDTKIAAVYKELGDVNTDGKINTGDAVLILKYSASTAALNENQIKLADFNNDSKVNTGDAVAVLKFLTEN